MLKSHRIILIGCLLDLAGVGIACAGLFPGQYFDVESPGVGAVADLDDDGSLDLVAATWTSDQISVLLNAGDGTFEAQMHFGTGDWPRDVAIGDLNGDDVPDVVTADRNGFGVSVLLGQGDGTFDTASSVSTGQLPAAVAIADLNDDSVEDLAVALEGMDSIAVLIGEGDGTFGPPTLYTTLNEPFDVVVADITLDGIPDLIAANSGTNSIGVLVGLGGGAFSPAAQYYGVGSSPHSLGVGDFNGDLAPDVVVTGEYSDDVYVMLNDGSGQLHVGETYPEGGYFLEVIDLNDDDVDDFISGYPLAVFIGIGDGTFAPPVLYDALRVGSVAVGDMDGDDAPDVVTLAEQSSLGLIVSGDGAGGLVMPPTYDAGNEPVSVAQGDLDGDGIVDLVVVNPPDATVSILLGVGDGTFADAVDISVGTWLTDVVVAHLDGDDVPDIAVSDQSNRIAVLIGAGGGAFEDPVYYGASFGPIAIVAADLNGDGVLDLATGTTPGSDGAVCAFLGVGDGTFGPPIESSSLMSTCTDIVVDDFDGNGVPDAVLAQLGSMDSGWLAFMKGDGAGGFAPGFRLPLDGPALYLDAGDVTGDGMSDIAVGSHGVYVVANQGSGVFLPMFQDATDVTEAVALVDLDGDGAKDLAAGASRLSVFTGRGNGAFDDAMQFMSGGAPRDFAFADFNGDGSIDVALTTVRGVSVLLNQTVTCSGDLDGDGDTDLSDVGLLLAAFEVDDGGDLDGDGDTDLSDLGILLADYGCGT